MSDNFSFEDIWRRNWSIPCGFNLTHWGQVTHIRVCKLTIIGSDNDLSPGGRDVIFWDDDGYFTSVYMRQLASLS